MLLPVNKEMYYFNWVKLNGTGESDDETIDNIWKHRELLRRASVPARSCK